MNICKYVKIFGQDTFDERPFNHVDSLVLSQVSYLIFKNVLNSNKTDITICELNDKKYLGKLTADTLEPKKNILLLKNLCNSIRFRNILITNFEQKTNSKHIQQFAAVTFLIEDNTAYIAYRGTDITILGWKEDLNLALLNVVPSQQAAKDYLEKTIANLKGYVHIFVGGHSKGGNLAVFAATNACANTQDQIEKIFDHDGPGFKRQIFDQKNFLSIADRIDRTVPRNSIVGILLNHYKKTTIVKSHAISGIIQHDPFNWHINSKGDFKCYKKRTSHSTALDEALNSWLDNLDDDERKKIIEEIFYLFDTSKIQTVKELKKEGLRFIKTFLTEIKGHDKETRHRNKRLIRSFVKLYLSKRLDISTYSSNIEKVRTIR